MSLRKLTAGDGYTYLTRQVAAMDATSRGYSSLGDYYAEKGESPGVWLGRGLAGLDGLPGLPLGLGDRIARVGAPVSEAQMKALFGEGRHPDAELIEQLTLAAGYGPAVAQAAGRLGSPFRVFDASTSYRPRLAAALAEHNSQVGRPVNAPAPEAERARVRTQVARAMFVETYDRAPVDARELSGFLARASRQPTTAVAGYDLTFSPVKSVSALWALAPVEVARVVARAHHDAVVDTLAWLEDHAAFTRSGHGSRQQIEVHGLIAAAFTHRDSRAGDPDLHTHVAISNKVQTLDGRWLALDGRPLHKMTVAASERYNTRLEALLSQRLGVVFAERPAAEAGKRPVREIVGVEQRLLTRWSARRADINVRRGQLAVAFQREHGRPPTTVEAIALAQQATLETRERKHEPRSLRDQRSAWRAEARHALGEAGVSELLAAVLKPTRRPAAALADRAWVEWAGETVLAAVQRDRAVWQDNHVRAEAERLARAERVPLQQLDAAVGQVVDRALGPGRSIPLGTPTPAGVVEPTALRRRDGSSVYTTVGSRLYTSAAVLAAEQRLVAAAARRDGTRLAETVVELALLEATANGVTLNPGQAAMVRQLACSGVRLQLALAPAGTGKTTAMQILARAWTETHGRRSVLGLAPSARAAAVLREEINPDHRRRGAHTDTLDKLLHAVEFARRTGWMPDWVGAIDQRTLVIIDEASMAGTLDLDAAVSFLLERGASVRLVGDDRQLAAIGAGGVLRDIARTSGVVALSQVVRFARTPDGRAEAAASLALREGDPAALAFYVDHGRVHVGELATATEQAYQAWRTDRDAGHDAILLTFTQQVATALNQRARAERLAAQPAAAPVGRSVRLADGCQASAGDTIIARHNDRRLAISRTDWVKNSDRFQIIGVHRDGGLRVRHLATGCHVVLPAEYVQHWLNLGYATTVHTAQGVTADVSHLVATGAETRRLLYVALTRGRLANHVYLATTGDGDPHEVIGRDALLPPTALDLLTRTLARDDATDSATTAQRAAADPAPQLGEAVARYHDALRLAATKQLGDERLAAIDAAAEYVVAGLTGEPAYPALRQTLALLAVDGTDPIPALRAAVARRELQTAEDKAAVLHWRLDLAGDRSGRPLPWLPATPPVLSADPVWGAYLGGLTRWIGQLAGEIGGPARGWTPATAPAWAATVVGAGYPELVVDLAVWRAAIAADSRDAGPLGPPQFAVAEHRYQVQLRRRLNAVLGDPASITGRWEPLARTVEPRVLDDPYWPQLATRLDTASHAGLDIAALARRVGSEKPLPDEAPAAAWWWRIAGHLTPGALAADTGTEHDNRLRPAWTETLTALLGPRNADHVMDDPAWTAVVAAVDATAATTGWSPADILAAVVRPARGEPFGTAATLRHDELATGLVWRITALADTPPVHAASAEPDEYAGRDSDEPAPVPTAGELRRMATTLAPSDSADLDAWWDNLLREHDDPMPRHRPHTGQVREVDREPALLSGAETVAALEAVFAFDRYTPAPEDDRWDAVLDTHKWNTAAVPRARLVELNAAALDYYQRAYPGSWVPGYLHERLGTDLTDQDRYPVGYAPPGWTHLIDHLRQHGTTDDELLAAGLAAQAASGRLYDRFRDRLVLPIHDANGDVVGFTARVNPDRGEVDADGRPIPKYLNTATTDLFTKGQHLYGLPEARDLIDAGATPVRVEGPLDAIAVTLAGDGRYVGAAPLGTALTATQAAQLAHAGRRSGGVIVATDPDPAGHAAATHDYWTLTARGDTPRHAALPTGIDPADLLRVRGCEALRAILDAAPSLATTLISERIGAYADRLDSAEGHLAALRSAASVIAALPPAQWRAHIDELDTRLPRHDASTHLDVLQAASRWISNPRAVADAQQTAQRRWRRDQPSAVAETAASPAGPMPPVRARSPRAVASRPAPAPQPARTR